MVLKPEKWDLEVDFIAVGSGCGAITGAIVAHDLGKKAVVLEKAPKLGGVTAYSGGEIFLANNHVMQRQGMPDSFEAGRAYQDFLSGGYNDPELLDAMLKDWDFQKIAKGMAEDLRGLGPGLMGYMIKAAWWIGAFPRMWTHR